MAVNFEEIFMLEYSRFSISKAFTYLKTDLARALNHREYKVIRNRWRLAERHFKYQLRCFKASDAETFSLKGLIHDYELYLDVANQLLGTRDAQLKET